MNYDPELWQMYLDWCAENYVTPDVSEYTVWLEDNDLEDINVDTPAE